MAAEAVAARVTGGGVTAVGRRASEPMVQKFSSGCGRGKRARVKEKSTERGSGTSAHEHITNYPGVQAATEEAPAGTLS